MILHLSQIFLTDALTFMKASLPLAQNEWPRLGYCDRVLKMGRELTILRHGCPLVPEHFYLVGAGIYHRFDCENKPRANSVPFSWAPEVRNGRILVHLPADSMSDEVSDD